MPPKAQAADPSPLVTRSLYMLLKEDAKLRDIAYQNRCSKSDLIRGAVTLKLRELLANVDPATPPGTVANANALQEVLDAGQIAPETDL